MSELPHVTILIANYNKGKLLCKAVQSAIDQDYPNKTVVVIDDASTDMSEKNLLDYLGWDSQKIYPNNYSIEGYKDNVNIHVWLMSKNVGRSAARNHGIRQYIETSPIFSFLDSDDEYYPTKVSKSVAKIMEDPGAIGVVYSDYYTISTTDPNPIKQIELKQPFDINHLRQNNIINNDSVVTSRALMQCGIYDETMEVAEDWDLWLRVTKNFIAIHIPEVLVRVGISDNNATASVPSFTWQRCWGVIRQKLMSGVYG